MAPIPASFTNMWRADNSTEDIVQLFIRKTDEEPLTINFYGYSSNLQANARTGSPQRDY